MRAYRADLVGFLDWSGAASLPLTAVENKARTWLTANRDTWQPTTTHRKAAAIKSWAKWAGIRDFLVNYRMPHGPDPEPHPLAGGADDLRRLLEVSVTDADRALITLGGYCGLRSSEILGTTFNSITFPSNGPTLVVHGKGNKIRHVPLTISNLGVLVVAGGMAGGKDRPMVPWSDSYLRRRVKRLARMAGLPETTSPHDLRHTAGVLFYEASGKDIRVVQELLGHANVHTTELYTGISQSKLRATVESLESMAGLRATGST